MLLDDEPNLEMPDAFSFTAIGSGSGFGSMNFGSSSFVGIGTTTGLEYLNSIGKELVANWMFNIGEDVRWTSFTKTFYALG